MNVHLQCLMQQLNCFPKHFSYDNWEIMCLVHSTANVPFFQVQSLRAALLLCASISPEKSTRERIWSLLSLATPVLSLLVSLTACPRLNCEGSSSGNGGGISQAVSVRQHAISPTSCSFRFTHSSGWRSRALSSLPLWFGEMFVTWKTETMSTMEMWIVDCS